MVRRQGRTREGSRRELQLLRIRLRDKRLPEPRLRIWELLDRRDGKVYRTIKIGSQVWIAQNLDFYDSSDATLRGQTHCYYDSLAFCETYGRLYTWSAVMGCTNSGTVSSSSTSSTYSYSGGIAGSNSGTVTNCKNLGRLLDNS